MRRPHDKHGDGAPGGGVERGERAGVVVGDDVQDDAGVGVVAVVAVRAPARGEEVELDVAAEEIAAGIDDGAREIGAAAAGGHAREDDAEGAAVLEAQGRAEAVGPAPGERCFIGEGRLGAARSAGAHVRSCRGGAEGGRPAS